jgi:hypothetical protein
MDGRFVNLAANTMVAHARAVSYRHGCVRVSSSGATVEPDRRTLFFPLIFRNPAANPPFPTELSLRSSCCRSAAYKTELRSTPPEFSNGLPRLPMVSTLPFMCRASNFPPPPPNSLFQPSSSTCSSTHKSRFRTASEVPWPLPHLPIALSSAEVDD